MVDFSAVQSFKGQQRTPLVAGIGDSRMEHAYSNYLVTTGSIPQVNDTVGPAASVKVAGQTTQGILSWLQGLSLGQISCPLYSLQSASTPGTQVAWAPTYNQAVGGTVSAALSYQLDRLLMQSPLPTHCVIMTGYNDIVGGVSDNTTALAVLAAMKANWTAAWSRLVLAGIQPITIVDPPADWAGNTFRSKCHQAFRQWQRTASNAAGAWWIDPADEVADISSSVGAPLATCYANETPIVHFGPRGSFATAKKLLTLFMSKGLLSSPNYGQSLQDAYDATLHSQGNLLPSGGLMTGSGGTFNGSNAPTGTAPTGWVGRNNNGGTGGIVSSTQARVNGQGYDWKIVVTATTDTDFNAYCDLTNVAAGDIVSGSIEVNVDASVNLDRVNVYLDEMDSAGAVVKQRCGGLLGGQASAFGLMPTVFSVRPQTEQMLLSTVGCKVRVHVDAFVAAGGSLTLRIGAGAVNKG